MSRSRHRLGEAPSAARQFTDREGFLAAFDYALDALTPERTRVLAYYGVGGIGKSALLRKLQGRLDGTPPDERHARTDVAHTLVDFQDAENRRPAKALERARARLHDRFGVRFPTFDVAFSIYWKLANPSLPLSKSELRFLGEGEIAGDVIAYLEDVPVVGLLARLPRILDRAGRAARDWWTERGQRELAHLRALDTPGDIEAWLPAFFAADLKAWLAQNPGRRAVLFFDTHEALWDGRGSGVSGEAPDLWLSEWADTLEGVLVVVGSRNRLRWDGDDPSWVADVEQHLIGALAPEDADRFLREAGMTEPDLRAAIAGTEDAEGKSRGVPQYLDLAMDTYEAIRKHRTPRPADFDANLGKLLDRFLSYVKDARNAALFVLSVPETFDRTRFADLMATFHTGVSSTAEGLKSITQFSFVDEPEPGWYALHALVREALAARHDADERQAIHRHLLARAEETLAGMDIRAITDTHRRALRDAVSHAREVLGPEAFLNWYWPTERSFFTAAEWSLLQPLRTDAMNLAEAALGPSHLATLKSTSNLAYLYWARGDYGNSVLLSRRVFEGHEASLGPGHPDTLLSMNNLAAVLQACGDLAEAESLYRRTLDRHEATLGPQHHGTLAVANNLGYLLQESGDYDAAEPLIRRALEGREAALGPEHPDTLLYVNNLAYLLDMRGDYDAAESLYRRALEGREAALGAEHPDTLLSMNNLAALLRDRGDLDGAEPLLRRALAGREAKLGPDHPDTLGSVHNLAALLQARGDLDGAERLYRRALAGREAKLGPDHPSTRTVRDNLAVLHDKMRRNESGEG